MADFNYKDKMAGMGLGDTVEVSLNTNKDITIDVMSFGKKKQYVFNLGDTIEADLDKGLITGSISSISSKMVGVKDEDGKLTRIPLYVFGKEASRGYIKKI